ncbi:MAG: DUF1828 domain-containing protein [Bacteroidales bacterium]|jgi:hypothetical protein|nr:DUF1828 domain-containing protein [Bacteroidales bacterium]
MKDLIESYISWLRQKINYKEINGFYEITTPFVNHVNDYIQFYLKRDERDHIYMTDDGETLNNLEMAGVDISTPARKKELESILNGFSVIVKGNELTTMVTPVTFPMRKHNFMQAIMAVDDLYVIASPKVESFFQEDVINYLEQNKVRFSRNIILQGKSTFQHKFDVLIPPSEKAPERIIKVVGNPKKQNIIAHLFAFEDTKQARNNEGIMILNDLEKDIAPDVSQAISEYGIYDFSWRKREDLKEKLVA